MQSWYDAKKPLPAHNTLLNFLLNLPILTAQKYADPLWLSAIRINLLKLQIGAKKKPLHTEDWKHECSLVIHIYRYRYYFYATRPIMNLTSIQFSDNAS